MAFQVISNAVCLHYYYSYTAHISQFSAYIIVSCQITPEPQWTTTNALEIFM
jgi:hypothetical protein